MINDKTIQFVTLAAKRIIESEHRDNFVAHAVDDSEHIPRMARIAETIQDFLSNLGASSECCAATAESLLDHARQLYVAEWMRPLADDENLPLEKDAIQSFNKYLSRKGKRTMH